MSINIYFREELRAIEARKNELFNEYDRIYQRINDIEPELVNKEGELDGITNAINQKMQEFEELNQMIGENDAKYQKVFKDNRETLDKTLIELRGKEEEYHSLIMEIDRLSRIREETQGEINKTARENQLKEETLRNLYENIEHSQEEIQALNDKIISLTEKESDLV